MSAPSEGEGKKDSMEKKVLTEFEKRILVLAESFPKGIPDKIMKNDMPEVESSERAKAINHLLELGLLDLYIKPGSKEVLYKLKAQTPQESDQLQNADKEERVVYDIIKESGNTGIWIKEIRSKSNLNQSQLNKILKALEGHKLIKPVKSIAANKKKVYMLYDLDPDPSVSGGSWYSDQVFDVEFATILQQQCLSYLRGRLDKSYTQKGTLGPKDAGMLALATLEDICKFISDVKISKQELSKPDIECVLRALIYDDKIAIVFKGDQKYYTAVNSFFDTPGLVRMPCGVCPVAKDCSSKGIVNPDACQYLDKWLQDTGTTTDPNHTEVQPSKGL